MSSVQTDYASTTSGLDVLTKGNPAIVAALPLAVLASAAGVNLATWAGTVAGMAIAAGFREKNDIKTP